MFKSKKKLCRGTSKSNKMDRAFRCAPVYSFLDSLARRGPKPSFAKGFTHEAVVRFDSHKFCRFSSSVMMRDWHKVVTSLRPVVCRSPALLASACYPTPPHPTLPYPTAFAWLPRVGVSRLALGASRTHLLAASTLRGCYRFLDG